MTEKLILFITPIRNYLLILCVIVQIQLFQKISKIILTSMFIFKTKPEKNIVFSVNLSG